jgi:hypothetical protein
MILVGLVTDGRKTMGIEILTVKNGIMSLERPQSGTLANQESPVGVGKITGMLTEVKSICPLELMSQDFLETMKEKKVVSAGRIVHVGRWRRPLLWVEQHM